MQRPEVNGWQVTTNENGVKMATLPRDTMVALLKYAEYAEKQLRIGSVSNRLLAEKIILALDDYGRKTHSVEYGLPIHPDTKDFKDKRPQEMLKIVTDILNGC